MIRVTVWNEFGPSCKCPEALKVYPQGLQQTIKEFFFFFDEIAAAAVTMDMPSQGLTDELLNNTDVLIWWAHCRHD